MEAHSRVGGVEQFYIAAYLCVAAYENFILFVKGEWLAEESGFGVEAYEVAIAVHSRRCSELHAYSIVAVAEDVVGCECASVECAVECCSEGGFLFALDDGAAFHSCEVFYDCCVLRQGETQCVEVFVIVFEVENAASCVNLFQAVETADELYRVVCDSVYCKVVGEDVFLFAVDAYVCLGQQTLIFSYVGHRVATLEIFQSEAFYIFYAFKQFFVTGCNVSVYL